jgi:hypothetical protein
MRSAYDFANAGALTGIKEEKKWTGSSSVPVAYALFNVQR